MRGQALYFTAKPFQINAWNAPCLDFKWQELRDEAQQTTKTMASSTIIAKNNQTVISKRLRIVNRYCQLREIIGPRQALKAVGKSRATLWRWQKAFATQGLAGLVPQSHNSGRRSAAAKMRFTSRAIRTMESLILQTGSMQQAWQQFKLSPDCPQALARLKLKSAPAPLVRLVRLTPLQHGCKVYRSADGRRVFVKLKGAKNA